MRPNSKIGKIDYDAFEAIVAGRLGCRSEDVIVGPRTGVDAAVMKVGDKALVVAEDPIFPAAGLPLETFGWFTVHIGASDVAVMGVKPQFATYSLLMPPGTPDCDLETIVDSIHRAAVDLDISIIGGHTGYYPAVSVPIVGGITVIGIGELHEIITPAGARPGDAVLMTKGPAIEAAALLAVLYETELRSRHGDAITEAALARCSEISVVKDALVARAAGPVSAMHDATEGGVLGGLWEIASASGVGMEVREADMCLPGDVLAVCEMLSIDPLAAISEGTLLVTVPPAAARAVISALQARDIPCTQIGRVTEDPGCRTVLRRDGGLEHLAVAEEDPFWPAYFAGLANRRPITSTSDSPGRT